jgi:CheY-like chemotaxis protein
LVIEDDFEIQVTVADLLREEGYEVTCAANGAEGLRALEAMSKLPSLIILDMWMPEMDGVRFLAVQRTIPRFANIPVLITTAVKPSRAVDEIAGVPVLMKPLSATSLLAAVEQLRCDGP